MNTEQRPSIFSLFSAIAGRTNRPSIFSRWSDYTASSGNVSQFHPDYQKLTRVVCLTLVATMVIGLFVNLLLFFF